MNADLSQSFNKLIDSMYENVDGCLFEKLPDGRYRWKGFEGTKEELREHIKGVWEKVANNQENKKQQAP